MHSRGNEQNTVNIINFVRRCMQVRIKINIFIINNKNITKKNVMK